MVLELIEDKNKNRTIGSPRQRGLRRGEAKTGNFGPSGLPRQSEIGLVKKLGLFALFHWKFSSKTKQPQSTSNCNSNQPKTLLFEFFLHKPKQ